MKIECTKKEKQWLLNLWSRNQVCPFEKGDDCFFEGCPEECKKCRQTLVKWVILNENENKK